MGISMRNFLHILAIAFLLTMANGTAVAGSSLTILPIMEAQEGRGWAAIGEMVMRYYSVPNASVDDDYQCGIANFLTGKQDCSAPEKMSAYNAALEVIDGYQPYAFAFFDEPPRQMRWQQGAVMTPADLIHEIKLERPVVAAISPPKMSENDIDKQQVALIVGYEGDASQLQLIVNDPRTYAFGSDPYIDVGGQMLEPGQYLIGYQSFINDMRWSKTIHHIKPL
jgi:hypothetical protein